MVGFFPGPDSELRQYSKEKKNNEMELCLPQPISSTGS